MRQIRDLFEIIRLASQTLTNLSISVMDEYEVAFGVLFPCFAPLDLRTRQPIQIRLPLLRRLCLGSNAITRFHQIFGLASCTALDVHLHASVAWARFRDFLSGTKGLLWGNRRLSVGAICLGKQKGQWCIAAIVSVTESAYGQSSRNAAPRKQYNVEFYLHGNAMLYRDDLRDGSKTESSEPWLLAG